MSDNTVRALYDINFKSVILIKSKITDWNAVTTTMEKKTFDEILNPFADNNAPVNVRRVDQNAVRISFSNIFPVLQGPPAQG